MQSTLWVKKLAVSFFVTGSLFGVGSALASVPKIDPLIHGRDLISGTSVDLDFRQSKRATVVLFLSARCPCSASHEARIKSLAERYSNAGFKFVAIHSNQDESIAEALAHFKKASLPFSVLDDPSAKLANTFQAVKTPHVYVVNPSGKVVYQGGVDDSHDANLAHALYLETALNQMVAGTDPMPSNVRVLGCVIKR